MADVLGTKLRTVCVYCGAEWPELVEAPQFKRDDWLNSGLHWYTIRQPEPDNHSPGIYAIRTTCCKTRIMRRQYAEELNPDRALAQARVVRP